MAKKELNYTLNLKDLFSKGMQNAVRETEKMDNRMGKLSEGKGLRGTIVGANLMTNAIQAGGRAVLDFEKQSISAFMKHEQFQVAMTTMFKGNRNEAELLGNQLREFAKVTPFELGEIQDATKMMIAYGSTSGGVVNELKMLGDISSGVGQPLSEIAYLYGTLRTQGRAYAMDIRQFAGRGIPIIEALAKQFGVSKDKLMELVSQGKVGFPQVEAALKSLTAAGGQFNNMMEAQAKTLKGQVSNLSDAWEQLQVSIGESQSGILKDTVAWATNMVNAMNLEQQQANNLGKAFKRGGVKQYGMFGNEISGAGDVTGVNSRFAAYNENLINSLTSASQSGTGAEAALAQKQIQLSNAMRVLLDKQSRGAIAPGDFLKEYGIIKNAKELGQTMMDQIATNRASKAEEAKAGKTSAAAGSAIGSATEVYGARPQNLTININKLIENFTISTTNLTESSQKIKENVSKALLEAVNDVNQMVK